jgi:PleD family two-component response regulator
MDVRLDSSRQPLVLIANDQEWSARSIESILAPNGYAVLRAYTGRQALERARSARPDLLILDAQMPDIGGVEVCRHLRADPGFGAVVPIIITTAGPSGRAQRLEAYKAGAWEFLGQPLDGETLLLKLATFVACKLETDLVREATLVDRDTGLYNMRGLSRRAREIASEAYRRRQPLACVALGLAAEPASDGPPAGLGELGRLLRERGRSGDAIGRLADGEFAVIAPGTPESGIELMVNRLEGLLGGGTNGSLSLRGGYCVVSDYAQSPIDAVEMLLRATSALRQLQAESVPAERLRAFQVVA